MHKTAEVKKRRTFITDHLGNSMSVDDLNVHYKSMTKFRLNVLLWSLLVSWMFATVPAFAQRQMEMLGRGVVAMRTGTSAVYVGWRLLGTDPDNTRFNLYRVTGGGTNLLGANLTTTCNFQDNTAAQASIHTWLVQPVLNGVTQAVASVTMPANTPIRQYHPIPLQVPAGGTAPDGTNYTYSANDCSLGDLDGDGEYEVIVKWDPSNSKDNSLSGYTGKVYLDAYRTDGTRLWRIDLGINIRAGAHYTQFIVYDLDGDGRAEMVCRTAPGTRDGLGNNVILPGHDPNADYRNSSGHIFTGPEYLTVFDGLTGAALATTTFLPDRVNVNQWGEGNVDRFLAGVAYLDGVRPSIIMSRNYYAIRDVWYLRTRNEITAWNWREGQFSLHWWFKAGQNINNNINRAYIGQGAHNLAIGDVDADGFDEIVYGACTINHDGTGLYSTGAGHGDALHLSDMDPDRPGLEYWMVHENPSLYGEAGLGFRDARTGALIWGLDGEGVDVGRGVAIDIDPNYRGYEMWGSRGGLMNASGVPLPFNRPGQINFAVYWNEAVNRELLDGTTIFRYNPANGSVSSILSPADIASNNGTKKTPGLSADILGDWREEVIWRNTASTELHIYTTTILATNRFYTLMHDPQYRVAIAWQNAGYNQPPHPGFYLGPGMYPPPMAPVSDADLVWNGGGANLWDAGGTAQWRTNGVWAGPNPPVFFADGRSVLFDLRGSNHTAVMLEGNLAPSRVTVHAAKDYTFAGSGSLTGPMSLYQAGLARLTLNNTNRHSGTTFVRGGALFLNGALTASPVVVERRGTPHGPPVFGGGGVLGAGLTLQAGCVLTVGPGTNAPGILVVSNTVTLQGALCQFDVSAEPGAVTNANDRVVVHGNLVLSGTNTIEVRQLDGQLGEGVYPLITYTGTLSGGLANLRLSGVVSKDVFLTATPGMIGLVHVVPDAPPAAPSGLVAQWAGASQINLVWSVNSTNESGLVIERSLNGVSFTPVASVPADTTSYADSGLTVNTTYYYRVMATNVAGASDYSNLASATTSVIPPSLVWRGDGVGNLWDIGATPNWIFGGSPTLYADGLSVVFDQSGSNNVPINLAAALRPGAVMVSADKNYTFSGPGSLAGPMTLEKSGSGTLFLSQANTFTGGVQVASGTVTLQNTAAAGTGPIRFHGGTVNMSLAGEPVYTNPLQIFTNSTLIPAGNTRVSGAWSGSNATLHVAYPGNGTFTVNGNMSGFRGTVSMGNSGGTFRFNSADANVAFGSASTTFDLGTSSNKLVNRNGNITVFLGGLAGGPGTTLSGRAANSGGTGSIYEIGGNHSSSVFQGRITNGNDVTFITKVGNGTLTLTGTNTYTGETLIQGGVLLVNGNQTAATGNVTVGPAGRLGGVGIVGGNTLVQGTLAPGVAIGTLTFQGHLELGADSLTTMELSKTPLVSDRVRVLGTLTLGGTLNVVNLTPTNLLAAGDTFVLFEAGSQAGAFADLILPTLADGLAWDTHELATTGAIRVVAVVPPAFAGIERLSDGTFRLTFTGTSGQSYELRASTNLLLTPLSLWDLLTTGTFGVNPVVFDDPQATNHPQRFYQLKQP